MTETNDKDGRKSLSLKKPRLELKKGAGSGQVRQNFSHGRSKTVQVEVVKKRGAVGVASGKIAATAANQPASSPVPAAAKSAVSAKKPVSTRRTPAKTKDDSLLTTDEKTARAMALKGAIEQAEVDRQNESIEAERRVEQEKVDAIRAAEQAEEERVSALAEQKTAKRRSPAERRKAEEDEARRLQDEASASRSAEAAVHREKTSRQEAAKPAATTPGAPGADASAADIASGEAEGGKAASRTGRATNKPAGKPTRVTEERPTSNRRGGQQRRTSGKLTIGDALNDRGPRQRSLAAVKRARKKQRAMSSEPPEKIFREVTIPEVISVQELANRMSERAVDVVRTLMKLGVMATVNQTIDADTAELVIEELGHTSRRIAASDVEIGLGGTEEDSAENMISRAPVVAVMGHVDHGKTSLLDALRRTDVASGEAGGITQHIGAYQVELASGDLITFLDTPGHEAFTAMRMRGAQVTDIVILVVAADDSVMPQTIEAIRHAKAAKVPVIIAINKIDKPGANADKVRQELLQHEIFVEEMGGDVLAVEVSALKGTGLEKLQEAILLQAEVLELKANPNRSAQGSVVESKLETGRGIVTTTLIKRGTLKVGDNFVSGTAWGKVRALLDHKGQPISEAGPSVPVEVLGVQGTPIAGDDFIVTENEAKAKEIAEYRQRVAKDKRATASARGTIEQMFDAIQQGTADELPIVIKADVQGSAEAIVSSLEKMETDEVAVKILHSGVGGITESDVSLAIASNAMIIAFNTRANKQARDDAQQAGVDIKYYSVIYNVIDDIKALLSGMLAPTLQENFLGYAEIREIFDISKLGKIGGCMVTEGIVKRGSKVRLLRDDVVIHEGTLSTLKRFKDEVKEVKSGMECGMAFEKYHDLKEGDMIECFEIEEIAREL